MPRFIPRQRKHRVLAREQNTNNGSQDGHSAALLDKISNAKLITTGKKQKRLEKYMESKLKKEESLDLLKKLSRHKFDTRRLQSSKNLGKRNHDEYMRDHGPLVPSPKRKAAPPTVDLGLSDTNSEDSFEQGHTQAFDSREDVMSVSASPSLGTVGSGLKQPLQVGEDGLPLIHSRQKKKFKRKSLEQVPHEREELAWEGFSDEDNDVSSRSEDNGDVDSEEEAASEEEDSSNSSMAEDESEVSSGSEDTRAEIPRVSGFKAWATGQINKSLGYTPSNSLAEVGELDSKRKPHTEVSGDTNRPAPQATGILDTGRKAFNVPIIRNDVIQETRSNLPIVAEEQKIMEAIHNNPVVIIWGATGSGKTTQVPQFLFESGYGSPDGPTPGMIGVTQPRRVAAVSMAKRVGDELGQHGQKVGHQIRFDSTLSNKTAVKFMTDGILMRELSHDLLLKKYSVIVIDEAHERNVNTDILIGMLSRIVPKRAEWSKTNPNIKPLKLVIMSATLNVSDFLNDNLFKDSRPPVVQAEGRQYPVVTHFARTTHQDYLVEVVRKVSKAHRKLPPGGFLVFLTGQNEIRSAMAQLQRSSPQSRPNTHAPHIRFVAKETPLEDDDVEFGEVRDLGVVDDYDDVEITTEGPDENDEFEFEQQPDAGSHEGAKLPSTMHILPLYSQLPTNEQMQIFDDPPAEARLIVLATNVAETSLTIPGIRYVFDCGRSKEKVYSPTTGVQSFEIRWISKASAEQRKGRAGRVGSGHCYRMYSSAVYESEFDEHTEAEIRRTPLESVVLQLKGFHFPGNVANFPFPTQPAIESLLKAETLLKNLGALTSSGEITHLGKELSNYPLSPRLGKMIVVASQRGCLTHIVALVAGIAVGEVFIPEAQPKLIDPDIEDDEVYKRETQEEAEAREKRKQAYGRARALLSKNDKTSDAVKLLTAIYLYSQSSDQLHFSEGHFLRSKPMKEADQMRCQLTSIIRANNPSLSDAVATPTRGPSSKELKLIKEIVASGFVDQIAIRADKAPVPPEMPKKARRVIDEPYLPLIPLKSGSAAILEDQAVYIHPSSVLARLTPKELPEYIVYSHLQQSQPTQIGSEKPRKTRMFPLTPIDGSQLADLAIHTPLLRYGKPVTQPDVLRGLPKRQEAYIRPELGGGNGAIGWPLPLRRVLQVQDLKKGWVVEKFLP